jgi:putative ABC transport system permease protein
LRVLTQTPGLTFIAILTLGVGIGVNSAVFTAANALLLRPLPYGQPDRLTLLSGQDSATGGDFPTLSYPFFNLLRQRVHALSGIAACTFENFNLTGRGDPEQLQAGRATWNFFPVLGVAVRGRNFLPEEDRPGGPRVVILGHALAARLFGAADSGLGQSLTLDSNDYTVIGVLPADFRFTMFGPSPDVWSPRVFDMSFVTPARVARGGMYFNVIGRLRDGATRDQAAAELISAYQQYCHDSPGNYDATLALQLRAESLVEQLVAGIKPTVLILWAATSLVLLIACANVASLLVSRSIGRRKEFALRAALGATRWAVLRQLSMESLLLAAAGGLVGIALAAAGTHALIALDQDNLRGAALEIDLRVVGFTLATTLVSGLLFGLAPALQLLRADVMGALRDEDRGVSGNRRGNRSRNWLVIGQVALSTVLLTGSVLLLRSFLHLRAEPLGFDASNTLTMNIGLPGTRYPRPGDMIAFYRRAIEQVRSVPGVIAVAISTALPVTPNHYAPALFEGQPAVPMGKRPLVNLQQISPDYMKVMRVPLVAGRGFTEHDDAQSPQVALVNQSAVRRFWPNESASGKRFWLGSLPRPYEVVGVMGDTRNNGPAAAPAPEVFLPYPQMPAPHLQLSLRTTTNPYQFVSAARKKIWEIDREQPITGVKSMAEEVDSLSAQRRFTLVLIGTLAGAAFFLTVVGIYGVIAHAVAQRTHELGVRMALGADRGDILRMVIGRGLTLTVIGLLVGGAGALALTSVMGSLLYEISAHDPLAYAASAVLFLTAALVASYVPARRATRIDPAEALRR